MKKTLFFYVLCVLTISHSATAQKNKIHFHSVNTFGAVGGQSEVATAFQTVNGIQFSKWFAGIGVGVDNYVYQTLPLFFDARRYFGNKKRGFVYGDIGYDFPLKNEPGKEMNYYYDNYNFKGGLYAELGIGFKMKFTKESSIIFSVAQSYKQLQSQIGIQPLCVDCEPYLYYYKLSYGGIALKTGVEF